MIPIRAVLVLDDGVYLVRRDGTLERLLAPGHPRPGAAHATAAAVGAASSAAQDEPGARLRDLAGGGAGEPRGHAEAGCR